MPIEQTNSKRLAAFCAKLPELPADASLAREEAMFALDCFAARRRELESQLESAGNAESLSAVRCEMDAFDAARRAIEKFWAAQFGTPLCTA